MEWGFAQYYLKTSMIKCQFSTSRIVLPNSFNDGILLSPGLFRKQVPLIVPYPIHEKFNRDKILNIPQEAGQVVDPDDKLITNSPKKSIPLPPVDKKVEISTKKSSGNKRKPAKTDEEIDFSPTKVPKPTNLSKYRLDVKN